MKLTQIAKRVGNYISPIANFACNIFCPLRCICCGEIMSVGTQYSICHTCLSQIIGKRRVFVSPKAYFNETVAAYPYEGNVRDSMIKFKFGGIHCYGKAFALAISSAASDRSFLAARPLVCSVPIHPMRNRAYNQSQVIAEEFARFHKLDLCSDLLLKVKNIDPLSTMGYSLRSAAIKDTVGFNLKYNIKGINILLIDDIYTTGSTANECSRILRMYGASSVTVLSACYADWKGDNSNANADFLSE